MQYILTIEEYNNIFASGKAEAQKEFNEDKWLRLREDVRQLSEQLNNFSTAVETDYENILKRVQDAEKQLILQEQSIVRRTDMIQDLANVGLHLESRICALEKKKHAKKKNK